MVLKQYLYFHPSEYFFKQMIEFQMIIIQLYFKFYKHFENMHTHTCFMIIQINIDHVVLIFCVGNLTKSRKILSKAKWKHKPLTIRQNLVFTPLKSQYISGMFV